MVVIIVDVEGRTRRRRSTRSINGSRYNIPTRMTGGVGRIDNGKKEVPDTEAEHGNG